MREPREARGESRRRGERGRRKPADSAHDPVVELVAEALPLPDRAASAPDPVAQVMADLMAEQDVVLSF